MRMTGAPTARRAGPSQIRLLLHDSAASLPLPPLHSILQNQGKTAVLPVLPTMVPLDDNYEKYFSEICQCAAVKP